MAKDKDKDKGAEKLAPLFPEVDSTEQDTNKEWVVVTAFHDKLQNKVVQIGDIVEWTKEREELKLIE